MKNQKCPLTTRRNLFLLFTLGLTALTLPLAHATPIDHVNVQVGGLDYCISTVEGAWIDVSDDMASNPWYDSEDVMIDFVLGVKGSLGTGFTGFGGSGGPLFAWIDSGNVNVSVPSAGQWWPTSPCGGSTAIDNFHAIRTWAIVAPSGCQGVPDGGTTSVLLVSALLGLAAFRRKIRG